MNEGNSLYIRKLKDVRLKMKTDPKNSGVKGKIFAGIISLIIMAVLYWVSLPALNLRSPEFWVFVIESLIVVTVAYSINGIKDAFVHAQTSEHTVEIGGNKVNLPRPQMPKGKFFKVMLMIVGGIIMLMILASLIGSPIFNASRYKDLIVKSEGSFTEEISELSMNQIPVVDRDSAVQLGQRKLGNMSDLVSQFEIATEYYTQINYQDRPMRVTPLVYGDAFKWLNNQGKGVPAYLRLDMVNQETELVRLEQGMKYSPADILMRDLKRHVRFQYPTKVLDDSYSFEIDEKGTPYWVVSTIKYRIGVWDGKDIGGAVLVNAITGESKYYDIKKVPQWVDRVYRSDLIVEQLNYNGSFQNGFINSYFGQRGVLSTTEGYNYIAHNDDVYLYTGMTSVASDQSNVGFVLVNMRTKETKFYAVPGATEISAAGSAEGKVKNYGYKSTFPLLLNVADRPTYFMSLKDNAGLVKMYAFVDVEKYQLVGTGTTVVEARQSYIKALKDEEGVDIAQTTATGVISEIHAVVKDGNTDYYFRLKNSVTVYIASIKISDMLPFMKVGDTVTVSYSGNDTVREVASFQ